MRQLQDPLAVQAQSLAWRAQGLRVGFVPTMGFLHAGHTSLMDLARQHCDRLIVSIFVNPLQFAPNEDLATYPRDPEGDAAKCAAHGCDLLMVPDRFYPPDFTTGVRVAELTTGLCGTDRPTHFDGVTTVVARLFGVTQPHVAVFGEKDFQQLAVIRRMVRDLAMPIDVVGGPLVREADGLALSSRNAYLTPDQRQRALSLNRALFAMQQAVVRDGQDDPQALIRLARRTIDADEIQYVSVVDSASLQPVERVTGPCRGLLAARFGNTRLIDNVDLSPRS